MSNAANRVHRRTILRGAGAALALPFLETMRLPTAAASVTASNGVSPVRFAWVFFPNGTNAENWLPTGEGKEWELTPSLEPLAAFRQDFSVLRGLAQQNAFSLGDGPGDHARSSAAFLTGAHPFKTSGSQIRVGRSIDQVLADFYGRDTRLPSIELGTEMGRAAGSCDSGYACVYSNNISWRTETQPMTKEVSPRLTFERLFGGSTSADRGATQTRLTLRKSILDSVMTQTRKLKTKISQNDRLKLDEYLSAVRDVEMRIERANEPVDLEPYGFEMPTESRYETTQHIRLMYDLMVLAFQTDTTRIATFMLGNEGSNRSFPMIGVKEGHHELSHHQHQKEKMEAIARIDRYYAENFGYFLDRLKQTADGESNLLDNSLIVYGGAIGDGNRHNHDDLPVLLAGRGGGTVDAGNVLNYSKQTPLNNLFLNMADLAIEQSMQHAQQSYELPALEAFGDSTGRLSLPTAS